MIMKLSSPPKCLTCDLWSVGRNSHFWPFCLFGPISCWTYWCF